MKIFEGIVVAVSMNNTVTVSVERKVPHPLYRKLMKKNKKFLVDSGGFDVIIGDKIKIVETKPISKNKFFKISGVIGISKKSSAKKAELKEEKIPEKKKPETQKLAVRKTTKPTVAKVKSSKKEAK